MKLCELMKGVTWSKHRSFCGQKLSSSSITVHSHRPSCAPVSDGWPLPAYLEVVVGGGAQNGQHEGCRAADNRRSHGGASEGYVPATCMDPGGNNWQWWMRAMIVLYLRRAVKSCCRVSAGRHADASRVSQLICSFIDSHSPLVVLTMATPGAATCTVRWPLLVKLVSWSLASLAATHSTLDWLTRQGL